MMSFIDDILVRMKSKEGRIFRHGNGTKWNKDKGRESKSNVRLASS